MIIRPVSPADLKALQAIARESGPGFTSLVDDRNFLEQRVQRSVDSFARNVSQPDRESYLFVLEDPSTGDVMGTAGIESRVGVHRPLYHYRLGQATKRSRELGVTRHHETLTLCTRYQGCSEVCTLFLRPQFRRPWAGKLLSRVRFLFMAQHPERFAETVIAEMRGVSDDNGQSPFWNWVQAHFVDVDFDTISRMVGTGDNGFIQEIMPEHPLYTQLMDQAARDVIGQVHPETRPALHMLNREGFRFTGFVDPFDAGPTVEARVRDLRLCSQSTTCRFRVQQNTPNQVQAWQQGGQGKPLIIANTRTEGFRATVTTAARFLPAHQLLELPESLIRQLHLSNNDRVCFANLESNRAEDQNRRWADSAPTIRAQETQRAH